MNLGEERYGNFRKEFKTLRKSRNLSLQELATRLNKNYNVKFSKLPLTAGKKENQVLLWIMRVH